VGAFGLLDLWVATAGGPQQAAETCVDSGLRGILLGAQSQRERHHAAAATAGIVAQLLLQKARNQQADPTIDRGYFPISRELHRIPREQVEYRPL
jgi:hypothetical protein